MIYIIKKKLVLLKNYLNYLKEILVKWVFKGYNRIFEKDIYIFSTKFNHGKFMFSKRKQN